MVLRGLARILLALGATALTLITSLVAGLRPGDRSDTLTGPVLAGMWWAVIVSWDGWDRVVWRQTASIVCAAGCLWWWMTALWLRSESSVDRLGPRSERADALAGSVVGTLLAAV
jgi:hypothetical protein